MAKPFRAPFAELCIRPKHPKDFFPTTEEITRKGPFIHLRLEELIKPRIWRPNF